MKSWDDTEVVLTQVKSSWLVRLALFFTYLCTGVFLTSKTRHDVFTVYFAIL